MKDKLNTAFKTNETRAIDTVYDIGAQSLAPDDFETLVGILGRLVKFRGLPVENLKHKELKNVSNG